MAPGEFKGFRVEAEHLHGIRTRNVSTWNTLKFCVDAAAARARWARRETHFLLHNRTDLSCRIVL